MTCIARELSNKLSLCALNVKKNHLGNKGSLSVLSLIMIVPRLREVKMGMNGPNGVTELYIRETLKLIKPPMKVFEI